MPRYILVQVGSRSYRIFERDADWSFVVYKPYTHMANNNPVALNVARERLDVLERETEEAHDPECQ